MNIASISKGNSDDKAPLLFAASTSLAMLLSTGFLKNLLTIFALA